MGVGPPGGLWSLQPAGAPYFRIVLDDEVTGRDPQMARNSTVADTRTRRWAVKDLRCMLGWHDYKRRQTEDSQYFECARCGKDRPGNRPSSNPWMGSAGGAG